MAPFFCAVEWLRLAHHPPRKPKGERMSHAASAWAMEQNLTETPTEKLVLLMLADCHNHHTGQCNPSVARMVTLCHVDRATIYRALQKLEAHGLILREAQYDEGRRTTTQYHLALDGPVSEIFTTGVAQCDGGVAQCDGRGSHSATDGGRTVRHRTRNRNREEEPKNGAERREGDLPKKLTKAELLKSAQRYAENSRSAPELAPPEITAAVHSVLGNWTKAGRLPAEQWRFKGPELHKAYSEALPGA